MAAVSVAVSSVGVVGKVVGHRHALKFAQHLKPAVHPGKGVQPFADLVRRNTEEIPHGSGSKSIENIMPPRYRQRNRAETVGRLCK